MSRFFADASSSDEEQYISGEHNDKHRRKFMAGSESESDAESVVSVEEEEDKQVPVEREEDARAKEMEARRSRYLIGGSESESDDDDGQRVVKSQRVKTEEELVAMIETIGDAIDDDSWTVVINDFDRLMKLAGRAVRQSGLPESFFDFIEFFSDILQERTVDQVKKFKSDDARAFNTLKQRFRKIDFDEFRRQSTISTETVSVATSSAQDQDTTAGEQILVTLNTVPQLVQDIMGARGKRRSAERMESISLLKKCHLVVAADAELKCHVLVALLSTLLEGNAALSSEQIFIIIDYFDELINLLKNISVRRATHDDERTLKIVSFAVSLSSLLIRCDDELSVALNVCDHHSPAYMDLVRIEPSLINVLQNAASLLSEYEGLEESSFDLSARLLDRIFYRNSANDDLIKAVLMRLYNSGIESHQIHAALCHVFIMATRNHFEEARQLFSQLHISDHVSRNSIALQILHNRTLVQMGFAAFRSGLIIDAYACLQEICSSGRPKELLGQSVPHHLASSSDKHHYKHHERAELVRLLPHHLHINIELLDTVFTTVSLLLELPQAAAQQAAIYHPIPKKIFPSRHLRRILDGYERSLFNGPPENSRETVIAAVRALVRGDWKTVCELLLEGVKVWGGLSCPFDILHKMLANKIRHCALLLHFYALAPSLNAICVGRLATRFELSNDTVRDILNAHVSAGVISQSDSNSDLFVWKEDRQAVRRDYIERIIAHLREISLPFFTDDPLASEYIVYGRTTADETDLFSQSA